MKFAIKCTYFILLLSAFLLQADDYVNPSSFDLRDVDGKSYINDIKDQSPYGTCYSFGTTSAAEGSYNYTMNLYGKNRSSFSETFVIWSLGQKYEGFPMDSKGDGGLNTYDYLQGLVDYGVISDKTLPYNEKIMKKYIADQNELKLNYYWDEPKVKFAGWHRLPANDIETMKKAMKNFGTIKTFVKSEVEDFTSYEDGVYEDYYKESDEIIDYQSSIDHSISLVGWTEDAWILRNSWGDWWGGRWLHEDRLYFCWSLLRWCDLKLSSLE